MELFEQHRKVIGLKQGWRGGGDAERARRSVVCVYRLTVCVDEDLCDAVGGTDQLVFKPWLAI